jgi:hypothetical protein
MAERISFNPDPPEQGMALTICYDFSQLGISSTTLRVAFTPGGASDHPVSKTDPCVEVQVPANAEAILVEDLSGYSNDKTAIIENAVC